MSPVKIDEAMQKELSAALRTIYHKLDLIHDEFLNVRPRELAFLQLLEIEGASRIKDLAKATRLPMSTVSWTLDRMVASGMLKRNADPSDRRAVILKLAKKGKEVLRRHNSIFDRVASISLRVLNEQDLISIVSAIKIVVENI